MTRCDELVDTLSAFVDGEESPDEAITARAHLETCAACRSVVEDWRLIETLVPYEDLDAPVVTAATVARRRRRLPAGRALIAAAIVSLAGIGGGAFVVSSQDDAAPPAPGVKPPVVRERKPAARTSERADEPRPAPAPPVREEEGTSARAEDEPGVARGSNGELSMTMILERTDVRPGRPFTTAVFLRNTTDHDVAFRAPVESPIDLLVTDRRGKVVSRRSERWSGRTVVRTLKPGESIQEQIVSTAPVILGIYHVHGECVCSPPEFGRPAPSDPSVMTFPDGGSKVTPFSTGDVRLTVRRD